MILIIDNYDSFTYNLVQYIGEQYPEIEVRRNDAVTVDEIRGFGPKGIVISPGPCTPKEAGISVAVARELGPSIPTLGVCLGHQSIAAAFGGDIVRAPYLMHGKVSAIHHDGRTIFEGLANPFIATRYHSLIVKKETCPACFEISARTDDGIIMGIRHRTHPIEGIQFHPESILTDPGKALLGNFIRSLG
jgi:anthranilate synthase/aminodeoxychorismate synthase-like glutamine amidotransferase